MKKLFVYLLATFCIGSTAFAQTPQLLNYQGVARNGFGNALPNRLMTLRLSIRNGGSSGAIVYQETRSVTTNAGGLYSVQIGSTGTSSVVGSMATINWQVGTKFLQVEVDPEAGTNFIDLGTTQLVSVPYAMSAGVANPVGAAGGDLSGTYPNPTVANGAINTIKLADAAVTTFKLADQSVTTTKLSDYSVTNSKLADGAVTTAKVTDGNITTAKLADAAVTTAKLADANVTTGKLADASVTDAKIVTVAGSKVTGNISGNAANVTGIVAVANGGTGATTAAAARTNLGLGNVDNTSDLNKPISTATQTALDLKENLSNKSTSTSLGTSDALYPTQNAVKSYVDGQITTNATPDATTLVKGKVQLAGDLTGTAALPAVAAGAITTTKLADAAVTTAKLADANITTAKLADGAVTTAKITDAAVITAKLADASVTDAKIVTVAGSKVTGDISGNAVNVTGTVAVANGGTGATTAASARTNLGSTTVGSNLFTLTNPSAITFPRFNADNTVSALDAASFRTAIGAGTSSTSGTVTSIALSTGTSGTDVSVSGSPITSSGTITLNIPDASATARGVVTTGSQTFAGGKTFTSNINVNNISVGSPGGSQNTMFGNASFGWSSPGSNNTGLGFFTLASSQGGNDNTAVGTNAIRQGGSANGSRNTAVGSAALSNGAASNDNVAIGVNTLNGTTGGKNIAIGTNALVSSSTAEENIGVGYYSLYSSTAGGYNTAIGAYSMYNNTTGDVNVAAGHKSLFGNTTGRYNTSLGVQSQEQNTTGSQNVAIGVAAIDQNATGNNNAVLGAFAGRHFGANYVFMTDRTTKIDNSILIGYDARPLVNNSSNEIVIGYNAVGNGSNTAQIGNSSITNVKTSGTITAGAVTYPNTDGTANQVLTTNGSGVASWSTPTAAVTTVGSIAGSSTANGATISGSTITLAPADGTNGGIITTTAQTIAGDKTFTGTIRGKVAVSSEITSDLTITSSNAETYNSQILICNPTSGAITITFNSGLPAGFNCMILQKSANANKINIAAGSGVTINNRNSYTATAGQYALATIVHIGSNVLVTAGDMQ